MRRFAAVLLLATACESPPPEIVRPAQDEAVRGGRVPVEVRHAGALTLDGAPFSGEAIDADALAEGEHWLAAGAVRRRLLVDRSPPKLDRAEATCAPTASGEARCRFTVAAQDLAGVAAARAKIGETTTDLKADGAEWAGEARAALAPELPATLEVELSATDRLEQAAAARVDGRVTLVPWQTAIAAEPGAYTAHPVPDGATLVVTGEGVVSLGARGDERFVWPAPEGATVAEALPTADGGARVRVVRADGAAVLRLDARGGETSRQEAPGEWPVALAGDWTLVRTEAGAQLRRETALPLEGDHTGRPTPPLEGDRTGPPPPAHAAVPLEGDRTGPPPARAAVPLEGDRTGLAALPDGGVVAWGAAEVEARGPDGAARWKAATRRPARVAALGDAVAVVDADGLRLLDAASGAVRATVAGADVRLGTELAVVVDSGAATAYGPDGARRWTASAAGTLSADGRVAWEGGTVRRLPDGPPATLDAPVRTAVAIGTGALALVGDERPRVVLLGADGRVVAAEAFPMIRPEAVFALADGLLVHGASQMSVRPQQVLVRVRALP